MRIALAAIALAMAAPASAQINYSINWNPQDTAIPGYTTATVVQNFNTPNVANDTNYLVQSVAGVFSEEVKIQQNKRVAWFEVPRDGMEGQYIGVIKGADYIINFLSGGVQFFSFVFNNLSSNDKLTLTFADGTTQEVIGTDILNGGQVIGLPNKQIPAQPNDWGRVSYDMNGGAPLARAAFHSGSGTWYIDGIASAAPEPATWAMLILGFGFAGWQLRRRRRGPRLLLA